MKHTVTAKHSGGMAFDMDVLGFNFKVDAHGDVGGENLGPPPKPLMLAALAGCTGMDVVSMLKKMKVEYDSFTVTVEGNLTAEHPKHYDKMLIVYARKGKEIPREKVEHAVKLSMEKDCGVFAVYRKALELDYRIDIS